MKEPYRFWKSMFQISELLQWFCFPTNHLKISYWLHWNVKTEIYVGVLMSSLKPKITGYVSYTSIELLSKIPLFSPQKYLYHIAVKQTKFRVCCFLRNEGAVSVWKIHVFWFELFQRFCFPTNPLKKSYRLP